MDKGELRALIKLKKKELTREEIIKRSQRVAQQLYAQSYFKNAANVYLYASYNQEVITYEIINHCLKENKYVAVPKVIGDMMEFHEISSIRQLKPGAYGILEPSINNPVYKKKRWKRKNLMILPGLVFDKSGARIGYGGGFYDRYIDNHPNRVGLKVAFAYDFQVMDSIVMETFDKRVDKIIIG